MLVALKVPFRLPAVHIAQLCKDLMLLALCYQLMLD